MTEIDNIKTERWEKKNREKVRVECKIRKKVKEKKFQDLNFDMEKWGKKTRPDTSQPYLPTITAGRQGQ